MEKLSDVLTRRMWPPLLLLWAATTAALVLVSPERSLTAGVSSGGSVLGSRLWLRSREKRAAGGTTAALVALERRLRGGEVPAEPERRRTMGELVDGRLSRTAHRGFALVVFALLFIGATVLTALTVGRWQALGLGLLAGASLGWVAAASGGARRRLLHMRDLLAEVPPRTPPPGAIPPPPPIRSTPAAHDEPGQRPPLR